VADSLGCYRSPLDSVALLSAAWMWECELACALCSAPEPTARSPIDPSILVPHPTPVSLGVAYTDAGGTS
jgi:hypothetical protein